MTCARCPVCAGSRIARRSWADGGGSDGGGFGETVWIGAGTTEAAIGRSPLAAAKVPLLARATPLIGHFQIRNRGTIGGSLAHADAAAEYPAVALALDAVIETLSPRGQRAIPAAEFFTGIWSTALEPDELLTGVTFRAPGGRAGFAVEEFARRPGDFAVAGTAIAIELDADADGGADGRDARVSRCAIGLFGLGTDAAARLGGRSLRRRPRRRRPEHGRLRAGNRAGGDGGS